MVRSFNIYENAYMRAFLRNLILRPSCYACPVRKGRSHSDITMGDHWAIPHIHPEFDDDKGTSLVLVNTEKGNASLDKSQIRFVETNFRISKKYNKAIFKSCRIPSYRERLFAALDTATDIPDLLQKGAKESIYECLIRKIKERVWKLIH